MNLQVTQSCCSAFHYCLTLSAQEFQALTAETDADAGEADHIKALFAEVDTNKDGKVPFFLLLRHYQTHVLGLFSTLKRMRPPCIRNMF